MGVDCRKTTNLTSTSGRGCREYSPPDDAQHITAPLPRTWVAQHSRLPTTAELQAMLLLLLLLWLRWLTAFDEFVQRDERTAFKPSLPLPSAPLFLPYLPPYLLPSLPPSLTSSSFLPFLHPLRSKMSAIRGGECGQKRCGNFLR